MTVPVRRLAVAALCSLLPALAQAQAQPSAWPSRPVKLVIPFAAGAGTDVVARTVSNKAAELLGQPVVAENRAGANGNLGAEVAARSPADGYTIAILSTIHAANQSFFRKLGYSMANDFVPVVELGVSPTVWVVRADLPVDGIDALAKYAKANPGKLTYGSGGAQHPAELFKALTGADITVVPYKGVSAALQDLLAGRVDMTVAGLLDTSAHIKAGKLRALATTNTARLPQFPDAPAMAEGLPGYDFTLWYGLFAPAGTPSEAQARLRAAVQSALQAPDVLARFEALSLRPAKSSQAEFDARVKNEIARWADTVKKAKIQLQD